MKNKERLVEILHNIIYDTKQKSKVSEQFFHQDIIGVRSSQKYHEVSIPNDKYWKLWDKNNVLSDEERQKSVNSAIERKKSGFGVIGPYTYEEACTPRPFPENKDIVFDLIPKELYNKKIILEDFEIHIQHEYIYEPNQEDLDSFITKYNGKSSYRDNHRRHYVDHINQWKIILKYHGYHTVIGKIRLQDQIQFEYCMKEYWRNWSWLEKLFSSDKNCIMQEEIKSITYSYFEILEEFFNLVNVDELTIEDSHIPIQEWWEHRSNNKIKTIQQLSDEQTDFEWFIKSQSKDGLYSPTRAIIDRIYPNYKYGKNLDEKLLHNLGIHTVQLRDTVHFDIKKFYDIEGVKIKAPKKVIERYGYEKYCENQETVKKIEEEKAAAKKQAELEKYNNTFTLMFHGKVVLQDKQSEDIISFLENKSINDMEKNVIMSVKPIFDAFPSIQKIELATFGTHYRYELAGENHYSTECANSHIDPEIWEQIQELYQDSVYVPDQNLLELKYGSPERGAEAFGVMKNKSGKLITYTEESDACNI